MWNGGLVEMHWQTVAGVVNTPAPRSVKESGITMACHTVKPRPANKKLPG